MFFRATLQHTTLRLGARDTCWNRSHSLLTGPWTLLAANGVRLPRRLRSLLTATCCHWRPPHSVGPRAQNGASTGSWPLPACTPQRRASIQAARAQDCCNQCTSPHIVLSDAKADCNAECFASCCVNAAAFSVRGLRRDGGQEQVGAPKAQLLRGTCLDRAHQARLVREQGKTVCQHAGMAVDNSQEPAVRASRLPHNSSQPC